MKIEIKRVYDPPSPEDGRRILVDRLWPRGVSKANAKIEYWARDASPSNGLRKWYKQNTSSWDEFRLRYIEELNAMPESVQLLLDQVGSGKITFVYSSKDRDLNNAVVLREYLMSSDR